MGGTVRSSKHESVFTMARELLWKVARATRLPMEAATSQKQAPSARDTGDVYARGMEKERQTDKEREREGGEYMRDPRKDERVEGLLYTRDTRERSPTHSRERRNKYGADGSRERSCRNFSAVFPEHKTSAFILIILEFSISKNCNYITIDI